MKILPVAEEDMEQLLALGQLMHEETVYRSLPYDPEEVKNFIRVILAGTPLLYAAVAKNDNEIIGFFVGQAGKSFFGSGMIANDLLLYVAPKHRGSTAAIRLLNEFEKWCESHGVCEILLGITTGVNEDTTAKLYEISGYKPAGRVFKKEAMAHVR